MSLHNLLINFLLAIPLLRVNGLLGQWKSHSNNFFGYSAFGFEEISETNFSENFFQMIVHPPVYLAFVCGIVQLLSFGDIIPNLWLVVPFYWLLRVIYALLLDTFVFTNWHMQIKAFIFSLLLSEFTLFFIVVPLLRDNKSIFIEAEAFRDAFWYAVFIYLAKRIWDSVKGGFIGGALFPSNRKSEIILRRYGKYKKRYGQYIRFILNRDFSFKSDKQRGHFICLIYAIMIYESHNRPLWKRILEYCAKTICPFREMSLGIMQVKTRKWISNKTSIECAIEKLYSVFSNVEISSKIEMSIRDYNPSDHYYEQVYSIYDEICQFICLDPLGCHVAKGIKYDVICAAKDIDSHQTAHAIKARK